MQIFNRPKGLNALLWALAFVWGAIKGIVSENPRPNAICLEMCRSRFVARKPFAHFIACIMLVYYALRGRVLRMDDTGLFIQLEYWAHDQQNPETVRYPTP